MRRLSGDVKPDLTEISQRYYTERNQRLRKLPESPAGQALLRLAAFSVWADELADDGYRDPRLSEAGR